MTSRKVPSASFWMKTVTPGRAPPVSSVTDPRNSVRPYCAKAGAAVAPMSAPTIKNVVSVRTIPPSFKKNRRHKPAPQRFFEFDADGDDDDA